MRVIHENGLPWMSQVPTTSLRSRTLRWVQLLVGLAGYGLAVPFMIQSSLGLGPWDAFHVGLHNLTGISIGVASILVGVVIVAASFPLGVRPGVGTIANMIVIGVVIDLVLPLLPSAPGWLAGVGYYLLGIGLVGISTGMYMAALMGNGPRDGLMIGLSNRTGWPVRRVRTLIEMSALGAGWLMGGAVGIGTLLFAVTIGPAVQLGLELFHVVPPRQAAVSRDLPIAVTGDHPISSPNG